MSRIWKFIKENPYVSTALVFGSVGMYIYWDQQKKQAEMEERIRRNREDSERRDLARREAAAAAAASPSSVPKKGENSPLPEASTPTPPMPRIPSLSREEFDQWTTKTAPVFKSECVFEGDITEFDLAAHQGRWVVMLFMPLEITHAGVGTPNVAGIEMLLSMEEKMPSFIAKHTDVIIVSPESKHYLKTLAESPHTEGGLGGVSFELVSDMNSVAAGLYGITTPASSQVTLYILAPQMAIQTREVSPAAKPPTVDHILERLTELQREGHTDEE